MATSPSSSGRPPAPGGGGFSLSKKIGPLPVWVYMAVIVVALYAYEKKKKTAAGTTGTPATTAQSTGAASSTGSDAASQSALEQSLAANVSAPTTNPQWEANAESILVGYGYPMVQVQAALNTYLAGGVLSSIQQEIVNASIEAAGAPPSPPATNTASTASATVAPAPAAAPAAPTQTAPAPASTAPPGSAQAIIAYAESQGYSYVSTPTQAQQLLKEGQTLYAVNESGQIVPIQGAVTAGDNPEIFVAG